jgi:hypothetical protein
LKLVVDTSAAEALAKKAEESFAAQRDGMLAILEAASHEVQDEHTYQNRTGNLELSTQAVRREQSTDGTTVTLEAGMDYASYVNRRGLMTIDERASEAEQAVEFYFEGERDVLAGL